MYKLNLEIITNHLLLNAYATIPTTIITTITKYKYVRSGTNKRKDGSEWIPMFLEYVDPEKCIGCGLCVKVCTGRCYEMQEKEVNGKKK